MAAPIAAAVAMMAVVAVRWAGRPDRHLAEAERLVGAGRPGDAAAWLDAPLATPRTRPRALLVQARIALERRRPDRAIAPLDAIDPDGPLAADVAFWRGRTLLDLGELPLALAWFQRAARHRPDDPETWRWLAAAAYDLGARTIVVDALRNLTRIRPDDHRAWWTLGIVTREAPEVGPEDVRAARDALETALRIQPDQPRVRLDLADVLIQQGDHREAEALVAASLGPGLEADRRDRLARCARARGDLETLAREVEAGLRADPRHAGLLIQKADLAQSEGRADVALAALDLAAQSDPYNPEVYYRRALARRGLGRIDEADRDARLSAELKSALAELARVNAEATDRPEDPEPRLRLGRLCERLGKWTLAASWYRAAIACDPENAEARRALVDLQDRPAATSTQSRRPLPSKINPG